MFDYEDMDMTAAIPAEQFDLGLHCWCRLQMFKIVMKLNLGKLIKF